MLSTSAAESVMDPRRIDPSIVVTSISTNATGAREVPVESIADLDVYVDAYSSLNVVSELIAAAHEGWDSGSTRGSLAELLAETAQKPTGNRPIFFRSVGLGLEDAAIAWAAIGESGE